MMMATDVIKSSVTIMMIFGLPLVYANQPLTITPVQFPSINDSVRIHCHFSNDDKRLSGDISLEWFDGPFSMKTAANGITIKSSQTDTTIKSTLVFNRIQDLHFGHYTCKVTNSKEAIETATTSLLTKGTNDQEQTIIKDVHLTKPQQVLVECNTPDNQHSSWKKVGFDQSVVSINSNSTSFYHNVLSLLTTGKLIYSNDSTVFCVSYVYPKGYQQLKFTKAPPSTLVYQDLSQKLLTCIVSSSLKPNMQWSLNNKKLESDFVRRVNIVEQFEELSYELQLQFNPPLPNLDTGKYTFTAENEWEKIEKDVNVTFDIKMKEPFQVLTIDSQKYMFEGADFTASCLIVKQPSVVGITIGYMHLETESYIMAGSDSRIQLTTEGQYTTAKLRISRTTKTDSGTYHCFAASFTHTSIKTIVTQFKERPIEIIDYSFTKYGSEEAMDNTISCKVKMLDTSVMNTTKVWFTHHTKHSPTLYQATTTSVDTTNTLITANLGLSSTHHHYGIYECITSASLSDNPSRIYKDSRMLDIPSSPAIKTIRSRSAGLAFTVQGSNDQSTNQMNRIVLMCTMFGIVALVLAVVLVLLIRGGHRSKYNKLNQQHV